MALYICMAIMFRCMNTSSISNKPTASSYLKMCALWHKEQSFCYNTITQYVSVKINKNKVRR